MYQRAQEQAASATPRRRWRALRPTAPDSAEEDVVDAEVVDEGK